MLIVTLYQYRPKYSTASRTRGFTRFTICMRDQTSTWRLPMFGFPEMNARSNPYVVQATTQKLNTNPNSITTGT